MKHKEDLKGSLNERKPNTTQKRPSSSKKKASPSTDQSKPLKAAYKEQYIRLLAEFDNYKKRNEKERLQWISQANRALIKKLLTILDDLDLACKAEDSPQAEENSAATGVSLIQKKFLQLLIKEGLEEISALPGAQFDPSLHEALATLPSKEENKKGTIAQVVNKGYRLHQEVIRFTKVMVHV